MNLPIQSQPVARNQKTSKNFNGVRPQSCFGDCMIGKFGVSQCQQAFESKNVSDIVSCLANAAGIAIAPETVIADLALCGVKCIF